MKYKILEQNHNESALFNILNNRGITDPNHYLHTTNNDINSPLLLGEQRLQKAMNMLLNVVNANEDLYIVVDVDMDGFSAAALLGNWLYKKFPDWTPDHVHYYHHKTKAHGLADCIDFLEQQPIKLVICPDSSSNDLDEQLRLKAKGIDCFCLDHHNGIVNEDETPAIVISNNITYTNSQNIYPNKDVSGVYITWQFCRYLDAHFGTNFADQTLDLVVVGDIADVMNLVNNYELRRLLDIVEIEGASNPLIKMILNKNEYTTSGKLNAKTCGWTIGPAINAVIRLGSLEEKKLLFDSMLEYKSARQVPSKKRGHKVGETESITVQAVRLCDSLRRKQNKIRDQLVDEIDDIIKEKNLLQNKILLVKIDDPTDDGRAITGLVANKLMSQYGHPVMLLNETTDPDTGKLLWSGSARNNPLWGVRSLQELAKDSGDFALAEGHDNACGIALYDSKVKSFIDWSNEKLKDYNFVPEYDIDLVVNANSTNDLDILEIADYENLWGQGIDEPLVLAKDFKITKDKIHLFGASTLKFNLTDTLSAIKFKSSQEEFERLDPKDGYITINIIGTCKRNTGWDNGPEILVTDYEVINRQEYYF